MDAWTLLGHAITMRHRGVTIVSPGVGVRLDGDEHVAVVYGGHRDSVDREAVMRAARAALVSWPVTIGRGNIVVDEPQRLTDHDRAAIVRAEAKRARRAARFAELARPR